MEADNICRKIVKEVPQYLKEGGFCQILCNWVEKNDRDWADQLEEWFTNTGCDAWVMRSETRDAATYASTWIRHTDKKLTDDQFIVRYNEWLDYYQQQGIDAMGACIITMRKSSSHSNQSSQSS